VECALVGAGALRYPPKARKYKYVGEVVVAFSIGPDGKVVDPHILESEPPGIFERSALKYVRSWRYEPPLHEGENIQVDDVAVRIAFQPGRWVEFWKFLASGAVRDHKGPTANSYDSW